MLAYPTRRYRTPFRVVLLLCAFTTILASPSASFAHAKLASSTPADGQTVPAGLTTIILNFSEDISIDQSSAQVVPGGSSRLAGTTTKVDRADRKKLAITTAPLPDGQYAVRWHVLTEDDNAITDGVVNFSVGKGGGGSSFTPPPDTTAGTSSVEAGPTATPAPGKSDNGQAGGFVVGLAVGLAIAGAVAFFFWRRRA